jgi:hypothetical protein
MWDGPGRAGRGAVAVTKTLMFPSGVPSDRPSAPADRPSERPTRPTLPPPEDPSDEDVASATRPTGAPINPPISSSMELSERDFVGDEANDSSSANASTFRPPPNGSTPPPAARRSRLLLALRIAAAGLLVLVAIVLLLDSRSAAPVSSLREPRVAWPDRTTITEAAASPTPSPAARSCVVTAPPRFVAPRALINPGLDVSSTATGFVVALASASDEASAIRLEGSLLRAAENVRLRPNHHGPIRRVVARDVDIDGTTSSLDVRADNDDARTVVPEGDGAAYRIALAGTYLVARTAERTHALWPLPLPPKDRRIDALRVAPRDDGGAVVVVKRGNVFYLGLVNGALAPTGPLQIITRANATLGTPFVVANGGGAAIAWAERVNGAREWTVMVASMGGGEMETKPVAPGMSPSLGVFADGTLGVAYADGPATAHRIVVRRLAADLTPTGGLVVASSEGVNAGQPVLEIRPDGRALVAWLAVARGQSPAVYATPLACDVSTSM